MYLSEQKDPNLILYSKVLKGLYDMKKCKTKRCKTSRLVSNGVLNTLGFNQSNTALAGQCIDACTHPLCGTPSTLALLAPIIYDEIGINLCATFELGVDISTTYPTADSIRLTVTDIGLTFGTDTGITVEAIPGRPNCYLVTLTNLEITFVASVYDFARRLLGTFPITATYLPADTADGTYNEDTNPSAVELEIYAPYGPSYTVDGATIIPIITPITLGTTNVISQGLNLIALPKVLDFDIDEDTVTVGLSLYLQSLYYSSYKFATEGRLDTPKGSIIPEEESACLSFVEGSLLNLSIQPLDLEECPCEDNREEDCSSCNSSYSSNSVSAE